MANFRPRLAHDPVRGELLNHAVDRGWRTVLHGTEVVVPSASCGTYSSLPFTC
jgi:hypothetical protein